jgi:hypothetical protein
MSAHPQTLPLAICPETGLSIHQHPFWSVPFSAPGAWLMGYWRADGTLMQIRKCNVQELSWIKSNLDAYNNDNAAFRAWLDTTRAS